MEFLSELPKQCKLPSPRNHEIFLLTRSVRCFSTSLIFSTSRSLVFPASEAWRGQDMIPNRTSSETIESHREIQIAGIHIHPCCTGPKGLQDSTELRRCTHGTLPEIRHGCLDPVDASLAEFLGCLGDAGSGRQPFHVPGEAVQVLREWRERTP